MKTTCFLATLFLALALTATAQDAATTSDQPVAAAPATDAVSTDSTLSTQTASTSPTADGLPGSASGSGQLPNGILNFQPDLFTGRFTYTVPIVVAPARQGAQPQLALGYNSGNGNGWCGVGWGLEVGFIQRETRYGVPVKWGSTQPLSEYDDGLGFIFSMGGVSGKLVNVGGNQYRAEVDGAFLKFAYFENYWLVTDKGGNKMYFGTASNSRMENNKTNWTAGLAKSTFRWAINYVEDANANTTYFSYTNMLGMLYLSQIAYNGNTNSLSATHTVDFIPEGRSDKTITFQPGYRVTTSNRLSKIVVKANGLKVRTYVLGYTNSPSTFRSLLNSVTVYGADDTTTLPPLNFTYQVKPFQFESATSWPGLYSQGQTDTMWNSVHSIDGNNDHRLLLTDIDADGLPDRVMRSVSSPYSNFYIQRNTGTGFWPTNSNYTWGTLDSQSQNGSDWNSPRAGNGVGDTYVEFLDLNGDRFLDRIMRNVSNPYTNFWVQFNLGHQGTNGFGAAQIWGPVTAENAVQDWCSPRGGDPTKVDLIDMDGDGLLDRVMRRYNSPYDRFKVQFNTGNGFSGLVDWLGVDGQGQAGDGWNSIFSTDANGNTFVGMYDINGDGLPDRVMKKLNNPRDNFAVQFNNGAGFETNGAGSDRWEYWGPLDTQGQSGDGWASPAANDLGVTFNTLIDINGDGLPDRVMRVANPSYDRFKVQINTGSGFITNNVDWTPLESQNQTSADWNSVVYKASGDTKVDLIDINGDGLPDRVMRKFSSPYDSLVVQLNKGPFPDLLSGVTNNLGGNVKVTYKPSTQYDNRDRDWVGDPWTNNAISTLNFPVYTVSTVAVTDGMGNTNTTSYNYRGGFYDTVRREFRGFNRVEVTEPLGAKTTTYFHQGGGRDESANGEYQDQSSFAKKGMPYRIEAYGTNGNLYHLTLNKIEEVMLHTNGWCFPFLSQSINMVYEGLTNYRATVKQVAYDTNTGNIIKESDFGEVTNVVVSTHGFTNIGNDSVFTFTAYASLANTNILSKPSSLKVTADTSGTQKLRETLFYYDGSRGNLTTTADWLNTSGQYVTNSIGYDTYGNPVKATNTVGIVTTTVYDTTYQTFPLRQITATFTNDTSVDVRSGSVITTTDAKGLVVSNAFDTFFRLVETKISTNAFGAPVLWKERYLYAQFGIVSGLSYNYVRKQVNDAVDTTNGLESYVYADGVGRTIQTRVEAETGQFRAADVWYDVRGNAYFQSLPYFSTNFSFTARDPNAPGTLTEYDPIIRPFRVTPPAGDTGSPTGPSTMAYVDGSNPWATVTTDAESKTNKSYFDAYGRVIQVVEVTSGGNYNTYFKYDLVGNLTNVTDNAGNVTTMVYDSLRRKTSMTDPDMGTWSYSYDAANRLTQQIDAKNQKRVLNYNDPLGRLITKQIYDSNTNLVNTVTNVYDVSDDTNNYTMFKGLLYKVADAQGWQKNSYDVRGRVLKTGRFLSVNSTTYTTQSTYDDADRIKEVTYPSTLTVKIQYSYDTGGNLSNVVSTAGTGTAETFYRPLGFNALGQPLGIAFGNGLQSTNLYYANSKRLQRLKTTAPGGGWHQDLSYTYDKVSNLKSIIDGVFGTTASATRTNILYDDLHRLTQLTSTAAGTKTYSYNAIGNVITNGEAVAGQYLYGAKPHAVTNANGKSYTYDANGNMITRGSQTLAYDEENQLKQVSGGGGPTVTFGYADGGTRLWKGSTNGYTIWIAGIFEIKDNKQLCHVFAGGRRIATFEPQSGFAWSIQKRPWLAATSAFLTRTSNWPFQEGRTPWTLLVGTLLGILGVCVAARRQLPTSKRPRRKLHPFLGERAGVRAFVSILKPRPLCEQFVSLLVIIALVMATTETNVQAQVYDPVFYYYHPDHLGSSSVMTDRQGNRVEHYEYSGFGREQYKEPTSAFQVSNRYTGQVLDEDTGLYYYNARYYDPELGRFIQPDSMVPGAANPQNLNRYSYVNNNPLNLTDPSGHGAFFSGLLRAWGNAFSSPQSIVTGVLSGGLLPLFQATDNYLFGQVFGQQAAFYQGAAANIILAVATIVIGVILLFTPGAPAGPWVIAAGVLSITSATLSIAATGASLAGDQRLAEDLGWAAFGTGVAASIVGAIGAVQASQQAEELGPALQGDKAFVKGKFTSGKSYSEEFTSPDQYVQWMAKVEEHSLLTQKYVGHSNPLALAFSGDDILLNQNGDVGIARGTTGDFTSASAVIRRAFAPNATIKLCGCESASGGMSSIAGGFKTILPSAKVSGYTGSAWRWWGTTQTGSRWYGITGSRFVEVKP
ncbi:MAG: hypothetical protein HY298_21725 [Verrucomicrobia bacterium]|nr:hypothetical protein [Verrucomicrobiota bacterium]